jgi:hypothetical protein
LVFVVLGDLAVPGLPGHTWICFTRLDWASLHARACSLPPLPRIRICAIAQRWRKKSRRNKDKKKRAEGIRIRPRLLHWPGIREKGASLTPKIEFTISGLAMRSPTSPIFQGVLEPFEEASLRTLALRDRLFCLLFFPLSRVKAPACLTALLLRPMTLN